MTAGRQFSIMIVVVAALTGALYFFFWKPQYVEKNQQAKDELAKKQKDIAQLEPLRAREADLDRNIASLQQQLQSMAAIVPSQKEVEKFVHLIEEKAAEAGVIVRRYTSQAVVTREFYSEAPFEVELDGQYYQMLNFFDRVGKLERIVNITNLQMAGVADKKNIKGLKKNYSYGPEASVVALCQAVTFFSPEASAAAAPPPGPPGAPGTPGGPPRR